MSIDNTIDKLNTMKLFGMARVIEESSRDDLSRITIDEFVAMLVDAEFDFRGNRRLQRLFKISGLRMNVSVEKLDINSARGLDRNYIKRLSDCNYMNHGESICITGPTGSGKSFLAQVLGNEAIVRGHTVLFSGFSRLMTQMKIARADHSFDKKMKALQKTSLLILDDFGLEVLDTHTRMVFYELLEERYDRRSVILISQVPVKTWHQIIGEPTVADAICDRLLNGSHMIQLKGDSFRRKKRINKS